MPRSLRQDLQRLRRRVPEWVARVELPFEVQDRPRLAVTGIELLSPGNKQPGAVAQQRYLEKRASALHGGLHWVEIDLLRGGERPPISVSLPELATYLCYVAQVTPTGWNHLLYAWGLRDSLPVLPIPLLGEDQAHGQPTPASALEHLCTSSWSTLLTRRGVLRRPPRDHDRKSRRLKMFWLPSGPLV